MDKKNEIDILLEPFRIALTLEKEGKQLFTSSAARTTSKLAKETFDYLAKEEDKHIERIERFYEAMRQSGGKDLPETEESTADEKLESFNLMLEGLKDAYQSTSSDVEAYRMALEFESGTEDFYEQKLKESDNPKIRRFYQWLIEEETMHSRLLKSCLRFVEDPAEWFRWRKKTT